MLYNLLLVILLIVSVALVVAVLMQAGKGGGLAANFGGSGSSSDALFGSRQASAVLTRFSWWAGGIFLGLAFILSLASAGRQRPSSVLDQPFQPTIPTPAALNPLPPPVAGDSGPPGQAAPPPVIPPSPR